MEVLVAGAVLGAVVGELLKAVLKANHNSSSFQPLFERLQSTLQYMSTSLDKINRLKQHLDIKQSKIDQLQVIGDRGKALIEKCGEIQRYDVIRKLRYQAKLSNLDDEIKNYFRTILPLDHFVNHLEMYKLVTEIHDHLLGQTLNSSQRDDSVYRKKISSGKLFLLKDSPYQNLHLDDLTNIDLERKGMYVSSYKCRTKHGDFLMKTIHLETKTTEIELQQRMEKIGQIPNHQNVILPFGYSSELSKFLLYEYAPASNLAGLLQGKIGGTREIWECRLKVIFGAAKGICQIHSQGCVHGNIKASNVIITQDFNGRISDFGLPPMMNTFDESKAPELKQTKEATQKTDIYEFGVMLSEIINMSKRMFLHPMVCLEKMEMKLLACECTHKDPDRRPTMEAVVMEIQSILNLIQ